MAVLRFGKHYCCHIGVDDCLRRLDVIRIDSDTVLLAARYYPEANLPKELGGLSGFFARGSLGEFNDPAVVWKGGSYDQAVSV